MMIRPASSPTPPSPQVNYYWTAKQATLETGITCSGTWHYHYCDFYNSTSSPIECAQENSHTFVIPRGISAQLSTIQPAVLPRNLLRSCFFIPPSLHISLASWSFPIQIRPRVGCVSFPSFARSHPDTATDASSHFRIQMTCGVCGRRRADILADDDHRHTLVLPILSSIATENALHEDDAPPLLLWPNNLFLLSNHHFWAK